MTPHQYLDKYPISADSRKLILGTIHPENVNNFKVDFFYGNRPTLWRILKDAYPTELTDHLNRDAILAFLGKHKIGISDTIVSCGRKKPNALDKDLIDIKLNTDLVEQIRESDISQVFFTSGFGSNNAFRLFYEGILHLPITPKIRERRSVDLDAAVFGRPVRLTVLYSPSGAANIAISKCKEYLANQEQYTQYTRRIYAFKVDSYRKAFGILK